MRDLLQLALKIRQLNPPLILNQIQKNLATKNSPWLTKRFETFLFLIRPGLVGLKTTVVEPPYSPINRAPCALQCFLQPSSLQQHSGKHSKLGWLLLLTVFVLLQPIVVSATTPSTPVIPSTTNELDQHSSPYLAMHGQDPVQWHLWSGAVLKKAERLNKPLFISSGYFSCHWCHVMQRENYHHAQTAAYINKHFIAVKIDRELNPEIDKVLIEFAQKSTGQAGWPQHVVLTPEGYPFASFIYLPNPVFNNTLQRIVELWQQQPDKIRALAQQAIQPTKIPAPLAISHAEFSQLFLQQLELAADDLSGGLKGSASKFPKAPLLQAALHIENLPTPIEEWLQLTLDQMQSQHLFDHIHGGFYRYTIDPEWQIPHFEKMAYTNALLADLYLQASQRFQRPDYLQTALATLNYLQTHLYNSATQLYQSSQSAIDADNIEGGDYLWTKAQLQKKLTKQEFSAIDQAWLLSKPAPYDQLGWHPMPLTDKNRDLWPTIRAKLQTSPSQIPIDSKSILGWNGLILSALSRAYALVKDAAYLKQANQLAGVLIKQIQQDSPPRALSVNGRKMGVANLQDYAFIYKGLSDWQQLTGQIGEQAKLRQLEKTIIQHFYTKSGWQYQHIPLLPGQLGEWLMADSAIPSPTALVSCLKPESVAIAGKALLDNPLDYASYLKTLKCIHSRQPAANGVE